ncbi:hypothetical protein N7G274_004948 [Stereocaulon virgatum]|uniref:Protein kinase domain-containing protein n=1 Tax=Stereocaulon virgatum TaxID=373712 RepID=A0ABR4AC70_9LECA
MSLLELLKDAYSAQKNYQDQNFICCRTAQEIATEDRIDEWSISHPLWSTDTNAGKELISFTISPGNLFSSLASKSRDTKLFHNEAFERVCDSAGLSAGQKQEIIKYRSYVVMMFASGATQNVPRDAVLPFLKRGNLSRYGSYGVLYRVTVPGWHLHDYGDTAFIAEKCIRPVSDPSQGDWEKLFREVQTLQKRSDHPQHHSFTGIIHSGDWRIGTLCQDFASAVSTSRDGLSGLDVESSISVQYSKAFEIRTPSISLSLDLRTRFRYLLLAQGG